MFGISMPEMILILAIALVVIGPKKLPDLARAVGRGLAEFRKATQDLKDSIDLGGDLHGVRDTYDTIREEVGHAVRGTSETPGKESEKNTDKGTSEPSPDARKVGQDEHEKGYE